MEEEEEGVIRFFLFFFSVPGGVGGNRKEIF